MIRCVHIDVKGACDDKVYDAVIDLGDCVIVGDVGLLLNILMFSLSLIML